MQNVHNMQTAHQYAKYAKWCAEQYAETYANKYAEYVKKCVNKQVKYFKYAKKKQKNMPITPANWGTIISHYLFFAILYA